MIVEKTYSRELLVKAETDIDQTVIENLFNSLRDCQDIAIVSTNKAGDIRVAGGPLGEEGTGWLRDAIEQAIQKAE